MKKKEHENPPFFQTHMNGKTGNFRGGEVINKNTIFQYP
jgi:hypothetical protein